ncbi:MAG: pantoate--beta-alanine ligase [Planctomycetota bacterium]|jgi:pantoate--beta-alanine ligase
MEVAKTIKSGRQAVQNARSSANKIGLVPTMGALHIGHTSLIKAAKKDCDFIIVSIFVNPAQFVPGEDFEKYPRPLDDDLKICAKHNVDLVFLPDHEQMYPEQNLTWVNVDKLTEPLCGRFRPGHFRGVTTVCAKLFNIVMPDVAYFGQKDAQQAIVIKKMVADLNMPLEIVICPTIREPSGLAVSSRNDYLTAQQRTDAAVIYRSLQQSEKLIESGLADVNEIISEMTKTIQQVPSIEIQYINILDAQTLQNLDQVKGKVLVAIAANVGPARLIDNILVDTTTK